MNKIYTAVKAIIKKENKFFIMEQQIGEEKFVDLPGGRMDHGEDPLSALKREVKEEICLDLEVLEIKGVWYFFRKDGDQVVCITYLCEISSEKIDLSKNPDKDENICYHGWLTKDEILAKNNFAHDSFRQFISSLD